MKQTIVSIIILLASSYSFGQNIKYIKSMEKAITTLEEAETVEDFKVSAEDFEKIAKKYDEQWLATYYQAYSLIRAAFDVEASDCDIILDKAQDVLDKTFELAPEESEVVTLQGFLFQARMSVDPMTRSMMYGRESAQTLVRAVNLSSSNPRALFLYGQNLYFTPPAFGGGIDAAMKYLTKAKEVYENTTPKSSIHPSWGANMLNELLAEL